MFPTLSGSPLVRSRWTGLGINSTPLRTSLGTTRTTTRDTDKKKTNAQAEADEFVEVADVDTSDGLVALDALEAVEAVEAVDPLLELIFECKVLKVPRTAVAGGLLERWWRQGRGGRLFYCFCGFSFSGFLFLFFVLF